MLVMMDIDCLETLPDAVKPREHGVDTSQNAFVGLSDYIFWNMGIYLLTGPYPGEVRGV